MERFYTKTIPEPNTGCLLWTASVDADGYGRFSAEGKDWRAHRFAWLLSHGYDCELQVLHKCDTPSCVNPDHLYAGTHEDNMRDREQRQRRLWQLTGKHAGERNGQAKLTWQDVQGVRMSQERQITIASNYGISQAQVSRIKTKALWTIG